MDRSFDNAVFRSSFDLALKKKKKLSFKLHLSIKVLLIEPLQVSARAYVAYFVQ